MVLILTLYLGSTTSEGQSVAATSSTNASAAATTANLPEKPASLTSVMPSTSYSPYNNTGYNNYGNYGGYGNYGSYGGYGSYSSSYNSPYSRYGGGMYGGYGGGGMGYGGMIGQDPNSLRGGLEQSTAATFQLIESMVGAVGGFAQMLESTYMATHSSFFAMMSVAEQFGHLKNSLGSILGIFAIMRWARKFLAKLAGAKPSTTDNNGLTLKDFMKFSQSSGNNRSNAPRPSFKPLVFFLAAVIGFPYLLGKLIRTIASHQETNQHLLMDNSTKLDPADLEFCRAIHDFIPENPQIELELKKGDLVAILSKQDPLGNPSQWWRVRTRDGRSGYIPSTYVEIIPRRIQQESKIKEVQEAESSKNSLVEEFQRSAFNNSS